MTQVVKQEKFWEIVCAEVAMKLGVISFDTRTVLTNWCRYEASCMLVSGYHYMMLSLVCSVVMVQLGSLGLFFVFNTIHSHIY